MTRLTSPRLFLIGAALVVGLTAGCRHCKNAERCEPNPCPPPPSCDECDTGWKLFKRKPKPCATPACTTCGNPGCTTCEKGGLFARAKKHCDACGKAGCTTCVPCAPAAQPTPAAAAPTQLPATGHSASNERFKTTTPAPAPVQKPVTPLLTPKPVELPVRPVQPLPQSKVEKPVATPSEHTEVIVVPRRSFADITARPEFKHSSDYSKLTGQLHYDTKNSEWRLRYASIDEEDRYGGSVTLVDGSHMMINVKEGMLVHVEGMLIDSDSRDPSPKYRIRSVEIVK